MTIRARSPLRISFGGGGTDVSPYCDERGGAVLSCTVNRYAYATLIPGGDRIEVRSLDYDTSVSFALDEEFVYEGQLNLALAVVDRFRRDYGLTDGLEVFLHNDAPPGSGLGSSSAITVALIGAFSEYLRVPFDGYQLSELAYEIERVDVGIKGGRQDQYATAFGGVNFIEFERGGAVVSPLRLRPETLYELEYSLVFAYVGGQHFSSRIIQKQVDNFTSGKTDAVTAMDDLKSIAYEMKRARCCWASSRNSVSSCTRAGSRRSAWRRVSPPAGSTTSTKLPARPEPSAARSRARVAAASCSF